MKNPKDPSDPLNRHNAAGEQTVIIGGDTPNQANVNNNVNKNLNNNAPTSLVSGSAAAAREPAALPKAIPNDPSHTRIIGYNPAPVSDGVRPVEPVVGWLVVIDGPGKGNHRPIYNGSNTIGRNANQRIAIDFGDDTISGEQQAFLVYDGKKRQFQLVPNLGRPNLVHLNDQALLANTEMKARDRIVVGRTTLLFLPLCGPDFDWSDLK